MMPSLLFCTQIKFLQQNTASLEEVITAKRQNLDLVMNVMSQKVSGRFRRRVRDACMRLLTAPYHPDHKIHLAEQQAKESGTA